MTWKGKGGFKHEEKLWNEIRKRNNPKTSPKKITVSTTDIMEPTLAHTHSKASRGASSLKPPSDRRIAIENAYAFTTNEKGICDLTQEYFGIGPGTYA